MLLFAILFTFLYAANAKPTNFRAPTTMSSLGTFTSAANLAQTRAMPHRLNKRQIYSKTMEAVYVFDCPRSSRAKRTFRWTAFLEPATGKLQIDSGMNVNRISPIVIQRADFSAYWYGYLCIPIRFHLCSYIWRGKIEGTGYTDGIAMDLITIATNAADRPQVTELCIDARNQSVCPANPGAPDLCTVVSVNVREIRS